MAKPKPKPTSKKVPAHTKRARRTLTSAQAAERFLGLVGAGGDLKFMNLWRNWGQALGPELAALARPLGRRGSTLVLGMDDPIVGQELSLYASHILTRVNGFVGHDAFDKLAFELLQGQVPLDAPRPATRLEHRKAALQPTVLGNLLASATGETPAERAYRAYVASFASQFASDDTGQGDVHERRAKSRSHRRGG